MMKIFILILISMNSWAQTGELQKFTDDLVNPLYKLPVDAKTVKEVASMEKQNSNKYCIESVEEKKCLGLASKLLPEGKRDGGWSTVLEVKYMGVPERSSWSSSRTRFQPFDFSGYYQANGERELATTADLSNEIQKLRAWFPNAKEHDLKAQLMIEQLKLIHSLNLSEEKKSQLAFDRLAVFSQSMSLSEYLDFMSSIAGHVDYNHVRAGFIQEEGAGKGNVPVLQLLIGESTGVCGDIHGAVSKMAEQKKWEAWTTGYVLEGMQHVVTGVVDPKNPNNIYVINYGTFETQELNENNSATLPVPTSAGGMAEAGTQFRIFKNKTPGSDGKMQQIGAIETALGSFMSDLANKAHHVQKASAKNRNYRKEKVEFEHQKEEVKIKKSGDKMIYRDITDGVMIYEGETDNAQIFGVAVRSDHYNQMYVWSEKENKCIPSNTSYFQLLVAGSMVDLSSAKFDNVLYAYVNARGGKAIPLIESPYFQFKGIIGYEFDAFYASNDGEFFSGDGNFASMAGVIAEYEKGDSKFKGAFTYETIIGLRDQRLMTDLSTIPTNVNPFSFNATRVDLDYQNKIGPKSTLKMDGTARFARVGANFYLATSLITNKTTVTVSYQGTMNTLPIGNHLRYANLYRNMEGPDGARLSLTQDFHLGKSQWRATGWGGYNPSTNKSGAGASLNMAIPSKPKPALKNPLTN